MIAAASLGLHRSLASYSADPYTLFMLAGTSADPAKGASFLRRVSTWPESGHFPILMSLVGMSGFAGIWIGAMLRHCRPGRAWAVISLLALLATQGVALVRWVFDVSVRPAGAPPWADAFGSGVLAAAASVLVALAIPVGIGAGLVLREGRKLVFQTLVRRARRRRLR